MRKQYRYDREKFHFEKIDKINKRVNKTNIKFEESNEVKNEHIFQRFMDNVYEKIENGESFKINFIESALLESLLWKYNRTHTAKLTGLSVRTIRNKIKKYGLK